MKKLKTFLKNYTSTYYVDLPEGVYDGDIDSLSDASGVDIDTINQAIDDGILTVDEVAVENPEASEPTTTYTDVIYITDNFADIEEAIEEANKY